MQKRLKDTLKSTVTAANCLQCPTGPLFYKENSSTIPHPWGSSLRLIIYHPETLGKLFSSINCLTVFIKAALWCWLFLFIFIPLSFFS